MTRKQVYKITYPNGKIYVGVDFIGTTVVYFGSPGRTTKARIADDLDYCRLDFTIRKEILWESETATDAEARAKEIEYIRAMASNNPEIGYNGTPKFRPLI